MIVVSDATPLIALARVGQVELLYRLFAVIIIPQAVYEEVVVNAPTRPGAEAIRKAHWIQMRPLSNRAVVDYLRTELDAGEAEVLVLARELRADLVLLDEPKARFAAELLNLHYIGTVGLLLLAKRMNILAAVRPILDDLRTNGFYLSDKVYQAAIRRANE
jgi:predicted nucleic acid-binding protein